MLHNRGGSRGKGAEVRSPLPQMTCGFLIQLLFCKNKTMWFIGVEVEQETSAPPPKKNPGSPPPHNLIDRYFVYFLKNARERFMQHIITSIIVTMATKVKDKKCLFC